MRPSSPARSSKSLAAPECRSGFSRDLLPGKAWECNWTTSLADGQMKLHARDDKGSEYDFVYELQ